MFAMLPFDRELTDLFLVLSDPTRLRLVELMASGEVSVGSLAASLGESQAKISRHLAFMREHGVVSTRRSGKNIFYALDRARPQNDVIISALLGDAAPAPPSRVYVRPAEPGADAPNDELPVYLL